MKRINLTSKKNTLACLVSGALLVIATDALATTVTSSATVSVTGHAPVLSAGQITYEDKNSDHVLDAGDVVKIDSAHPFSFTDADGDDKQPETYSWKIDGNEVSTTDTYTVKAGDLNKRISLEATPHTDSNTTDPAIGLVVKATTSTGGEELPIATGEEVTGVTITGGTGAANAPLVKDVLTANPTCSGGACGGTLKYQWQAETGYQSGQYADIAGATNSTWTVTRDVQKRKIQVIVSNPAAKSANAEKSAKPDTK